MDAEEKATLEINTLFLRSALTIMIAIHGYTEAKHACLETMGR